MLTGDDRQPLRLGPLVGRGGEDGESDGGADTAGDADSPPLDSALPGGGEVETP